MRHLAPATALALFPGGGGRSKQVPGSERAYTQAQIDDAFNPPDWFPPEAFRKFLVEDRLRGQELVRTAGVKIAE